MLFGVWGWGVSSVVGVGRWVESVDVGFGVGFGVGFDGSGRVRAAARGGVGDLDEHVVGGGDKTMGVDI